MQTRAKQDQSQETEHSVNLQDVNRLLELGKLLSSVLTEEELQALQDAIMTNLPQKCLRSAEKIGNTSVS